MHAHHITPPLAHDACLFWVLQCLTSHRSARGEDTASLVVLCGLSALLMSLTSPVVSFLMYAINCWFAISNGVASLDLIMRDLLNSFKQFRTLYLLNFWICHGMMTEYETAGFETAYQSALEILLCLWNLSTLCKNGCKSIHRSSVDCLDPFRVVTGAAAYGCKLVKPIVVWYRIKDAAWFLQRNCIYKKMQQILWCYFWIES